METQERVGQGMECMSTGLNVLLQARSPANGGGKATARWSILAETAIHCLMPDLTLRCDFGQLPVMASMLASKHHVIPMKIVPALLVTSKINNVKVCSIGLQCNLMQLCFEKLIRMKLENSK